MRKRNSILILAFAATLLLLIGSLFVPLPGYDLRKETIHSMRVLDRRGVLLREFLNDREGRGRWVDLAQIAPPVQQATIAIEDKRFMSHPGLDPVSLVRATIQNLEAGGFVSGGSTITQQLVRNVYYHPRSLWYKLVEAWYALRLERMMSKSEILEQYLNRAPYGNQLFGIESASRQYFARPARDLSLAESAFLAGLPNAPTFLNPYANRGAAVTRQRAVLKKMLEQKLISPDECDRAILQPLHIVQREVQFRAPHAVEMVAAQFRDQPEVTVVHTTIDDLLQQNIQWLVKGHLATLTGKNVTNAAAVVMENSTGEVRALIGSADYFDDVHDGQVNGALALRQPGSAIKPFTYGVALESGYSPADILADIPTHIPDDRGDYIPENYDKRYHGPVRLRTALACSYNIPAVRVLQTIGRETLLDRLRQAGCVSLNQTAEYYGYGLTLGNGEVSLLELTSAYAVLANSGVWKKVQLIRSIQAAEGSPEIPFPLQSDPPRRVFDARTAYLLSNILNDPVARRPAFGNAFQFPFMCAVKTGTTKDYRDNWAMGYTTVYTVGVWVGNFDASPMHGVSGITGAGQIFSDIMMLLHSAPSGLFPLEFVPPAGLERRDVCPRSGMLPNENCSKVVREWFPAERIPKERCRVHRQYRVAARNGGTRTRVFEVFSPEYQAWCKEQHMAMPPEDAVPLLPAERTPLMGRRDEIREILRIASPNNGDEFKIDPVLRGEFQSIRISGLVPAEVSNLTLRVNGTTLLPYFPTGVWWRLKKGSHSFQLVGLKGRRRVVSDVVTIRVE